MVQLRALAHFGLPSSAGCAGNRMLAAMACALTPPGRRTVIDDSPEAITAFLRPRPVRELPGVGAKTAATLAEYGLHTAGDVADVPQSTLQRLLGARAGRALHEHAHGRDTTIVSSPDAPDVSQSLRTDAAAGSSRFLRPSANGRQQGSFSASHWGCVLGSGVPVPT
ncbi:DNA polymerase thumb domain-containing protein [Streptomyces sp. BK340]|uniref:DNA polymerase thumb domain-containing protein n=1 Tax=Streptomyces sp. BK340 TaxID=2572903 RepID=UPI0021BD6D03|nr:hypothetical protein [Streptomyces sp. BK340]